jgi:hypothetical protein
MRSFKMLLRLFAASIFLANAMVGAEAKTSLDILQ